MSTLCAPYGAGSGYWVQSRSAWKDISHNGPSSGEWSSGEDGAPTFSALAAYVMFQAVWRLWTANAPNESVVGIVLAVLSLIVMPLIALAKLRVARAVNSPALRAEAKETLACSYLSYCLLLGLVANASLDFWWADPVAALLMVPWLVIEGTEASTSEGD
jgi:divalent metal cation (Fe/Co/Zn/Cd) transporter